MKIEKIQFYNALKIHKKSLAEVLNLKKVPNSIQDFKELSQEDLRKINKGMVHSTTAYLCGQTHYEVFEQSFLELPDDLRFGYYALFDETFPLEDYISLLYKLEAFITKSKLDYENSNKPDHFYNIKGIRAAYLIKAFCGYIEFGRKMYEKSLAIFQDIANVQPKNEIKAIGMIALNYFLLEKNYDEFEKCVLNEKYNDPLLKYLKTVYYYYVKKDITAAMNAVFPAILNNPFVFDIDQVLFPDVDNLSDKGLSIMLEAQLVFDYIVPILGIESFDLFYKKAKEVRKVIEVHPELSTILDSYYKNREKEEVLTD